MQIITHKILVLLLTSILVISGYGQHTMRMKYKVPAMVSAKSAADSVLYIKPGYHMTGMVIRIDTSDSFHNTFIIAGSDTINIRADEHSKDTSFLSSNLIVFKNKISEFSIYPHAIDKDIEFLFIDASPSKKVLKKSGRKKKRCRLFRTSND